MADDCTPTTEEVRDCYATGGPMPGERLIQRFADEYAEFDRWLAAHDAEVERRVLDRVEAAARQVDAAHHLYLPVGEERPACLCGWAGDARKRTQTEHITSAVVSTARGVAS